ncbi:MAG: MerR family DNA-binding protein [Erysipelotrichaceae bacterium]
MIRGIILIRFLQEIGFTLSQIKEMHKQSAEEIKNLLKETYRRLDERISSLDILKDKTDKVIQLLDKEDIDDITDLIKVIQ